jgi:Na+/H+ antiporter NhaD/arsenite permease-like protein
MSNLKLFLSRLGILSFFMLFPAFAMAAGGGVGQHGQDFTMTGFGMMAILVFVAAYALVIGEEVLHLRKSIPVIIGAGIIWILVGLAYHLYGSPEFAAQAIEHNILEFGELFLFLLAAMTFVNTMEERQVFNALRAWLVSRGLSLRSIFWITGLLAFFISPVADNLTTALLMAAVVMAVGADNKRFVVIACVNIVVAANAGGAFSPFGDITTLMVWQKGIVEFWDFFALFLPSAVNWLIPAAIMSFAVPKGTPEALEEQATVLHGGYQVIALFLLTIMLAVSVHNFLGLPPVLGMMTGLGLLKLYGHFLKTHTYYRLYHQAQHQSVGAAATGAIDGSSADDSGSSEASAARMGGDGFTSEIKSSAAEAAGQGSQLEVMKRYDVYNIVARSEWDTLMFFYGVVLCVGGLATLGYLSVASNAMYAGLGVTEANILVGLLSAVVDNIPVMFAVLTMHPEMGLDQWLLVTLTAGVGGSLLSVGSAAGVALMGQARGMYTFFSHLKWTWAIALGYGTAH